MKKSCTNFLTAAGFILTLLTVWQVAARGHFLVPPPTEVISALWALLKLPATWSNIGLTTLRVYVSLAAAIALGTGAGTLAFFNKPFGVMAAAVMLPLQYIAAAVVSILAVVIFGLSPLSAFFVITITILPNIYIASSLGLKEIRQDYLELGEMYTGSRWKLFHYIVFPHMVPYFMVGIVRAHAVAWKIAVTAEVFIAAGGLGFMVNHYYKMLQISRLFATVVIIILLGMAFDKVMLVIKSRMFRNYETVPADQ